MPRTGIPMGSTEIGNLGVSSAAPVPTITVTPTIAHRANDPDGARRHASGPEHDAVPAATDPITGIPNISGTPSTVPALSPGATMFR